MTAKSKTSLISHNITINGKRTSVRLEKEMWLALQEIALREKCSVHDICSRIAAARNSEGTLSAAIRAFTIGYYKAAATDEGHLRAGHGLGPAVVSSIIEESRDKPYYGLRTAEYNQKQKRSRNQS